MKNINLNIIFVVLLILSFFTSCKNGKGDYLQTYEDYNEFNKIHNPRLTGWFPVELIREDAQNLKNISYLSTKCVFGVFDYENEKLYDSIFNKGNYIDETHIKIFKTQIITVKNIIPEWFPKVDYWKTKNKGIILFDNCYVYKDPIEKQIYYFHPEEESTYIDGEIYPGIRNTIR